MPVRRRDAHKGDFGHVLIVGGALGMSGSIALAGRAALRGGAGLVTLAAPAASQPIVAALAAEAMTLPLPDRPDGRLDPAGAARRFSAQAGRWTVLAAGCGWSTADGAFAVGSVALMEQLSRMVGGSGDEAAGGGAAGSVGHGPTVIDADGLNLLASTGRLERAPWPNLVITPHPGELARLVGRPTREIQAGRMAAAADAVARLNGPVLVLKGAGTIVTDGRRVYVNTTGNPGMASGGSGDVLTGLLAGLLAQKLDPFDAAVLAVYLHGLAGDLAARKLGQPSLIAGDLIDFLPEALVRHARRK